MKSGFATPEGTKRYAERFAGRLDAGHFRELHQLVFSSVGVGSYLGNPDGETDKLYETSLREAVLGGVNVIDTAVNYRAQRSERSFGRSLNQLFDEGKIGRDEVIVCTKGGFLPFDGSYPPDPREYFKRIYIETGLLKETDIAQECHAMTPAYLEDQLSRSLANLGLETVDVYYLHNPETQLAEIDSQEFRRRLAAVFKWMEEKVREGKIRMYGTATWDGYRVQEDQAGYLSMEDLHLLAREAAGAGHHFKMVQLPFNLAMPEAWVLPNQRFGAGAVPLLHLAKRLGLGVIASASLLQARLTGEFPDFLARQFKELDKSSQRAIQFARSVPGITTALVGMKQVSHVRENLKVADVAPLTEETLIAMFQKA